MRVQKYLAMCGVASRRKAEELIREGKVKVNDITAVLGMSVKEGDGVKVDGVEVRQPSGELIYIALNKPVGIVTTSSDEFGRKTVMDLVRDDVKERIFPVGRLDKDTEGLLLMTNDGALAHALTHPKYEVSKTYTVVVDDVSEEDIAKLERGVLLDGRKTAPAKITNIQRSVKGVSLRITIHEGRNRQIRKMFEEVGSRVIFLKRISIGKIKLGDLKIGEFRFLSKEEIEYLKNNNFNKGI